MKVELLPLPADQVRRLSLKHHLALAALCDGRGDIGEIVTLSNVLHLAFYLRVDQDAEPYRRAETAINQCVARAERGEPWTLTSAERIVLEALVVHHDQQLAEVPVHHYLDALERAQRADVRGGGLPI
ncbi:hypothetical protein QZM22_00690 [Burkholderia oklahomensis]|uniref:hypothetical protein n=1 Tax=Burkholderia oklahomensis TaxID=342113 RepID=UPI0026548502|nr:hypothetical protein [Burkholderia oklahomensis]MDN7671077.1 hypothetical protein [Burkholderia oklahomensis]